MKTFVWDFFRIIVVLFFILHFTGSPAFSGVVVLKSGEEITGLITKKTEEHIEILVNKEVKIYKHEDIEYIRGKKPVFISKEKVDPSDTESMFIKGLELAASGFFLDAEEILKSIIPPGYLKSDIKQALNTINELRQGVIDSNFVLYLFKGDYYLRIKKYPDAIVAYKKVLEIEPDNAAINYNLANAYQVMGKYEGALPYLEKLIKIDPSDREVLFRLGLSHHSLGQYRQSISCLEKAISIFEDDPESNSLLGVVYYSIGEYKKAKKYLVNAKDLYVNKGYQEKAEEVNLLIEALPE